MAVLGLILLAAAGVLTAAVVTSNTDSLSVSLWSLDVSNVTLGVVFVAGMITTVLAVVGLGLLMGGMRRNRRLRKERRTLQRENEQLSQRADSSPPPMAATGPIPTTSRRDERVVEERRLERPVDDDRTSVQEPVSMGPGHDDTAVDESATTTQRRRPFLPRQEPTTTETVSRDA